MASLVLTDSSQLTSDSQQLGQGKEDKMDHSSIKHSSPDRDSNLELPVLGSQAQHETSALVNYATEAGRIKFETLPVIKRELKDMRCCDGDAVTLECRVQATPTPDIRWEKGGRLLPLGGDFVSEFDGETARLTIHQVYPEDEGEYTCVAYSDLGRAATSACLVVDVSFYQ
uniref:Ig-like domain-containing protein n=1 Tax=Timema bartmani TaxID=61472 RepID=A0A7R9ETE5_9NEOP|nr:unnamed protein product [Timema bartmani]